MPGSNVWEMERRYSMAENDRSNGGIPPPSFGMMPSTSEDLHAWSIYRQNLNSDFTDSALGSSEKSPLPYGNFQLRESTVQSILSHPRYGPKSALGQNMYTYLKFGLPRVFPPNNRKETSSGYNSSDEGTKRSGRKSSYMRARSEADLINMHYQPGITARGKSISQANLLSPDIIMRREAATHRRSLHDLRHMEYGHHMPPTLGRPSSMALPNHLSVPGLHHHMGHHNGIHHHRAPSALSTLPPPTTPFTFSMLHPQQYTGLYPHLQVRNLNVRSGNGEPLINNLSMEVKAGEILAVMATNANVSRGVVEVLSGRRRGRYSGQVSLNGQPVTARALRQTVGLVSPNVILPHNLAVHNCLRFYSKLRRPPESRGKVPTGEQVRMVTEELGLAPVLGTKISELTRSEYSRLLVAIQLLADPQVLCIDHITHSMDIFDTFFLVEFLRQWASGATGGVTGRIVVMVLQPPTYEILTMVSRLVIISSGETMYHGFSRHLTQYFTSADYPCPNYKNPADYYLDLVTLDDLSAEAMLESSQRVDQLAALYKRRQQPLSEAQPYSLPTKFRTAGPFGQAYSLFLKEAVYSQPAGFTNWMSRVLLAILLSVITGCVFWDIPYSDPNLSKEDRLGYHYSVLCVCSIPLLLLLSMSKGHAIRSSAESDIQQGLYSRLVYIICTLIFWLLPSALVWMAYLVPAYCMSGLYDQGSSDALTMYLGYTLFTLLALQYTLFLVRVIASSRALSVVLILAMVLPLFSSPSGFPVHNSDLPGPLTTVTQVSPLYWAYPGLLYRDYSKETLTSLDAHLTHKVCRNKQVQHQEIIVQLPCPVPNGTAALNFRGLTPKFFHNLPVFAATPFSPPLILLGSSALLTVLLYSILPCVACTRQT